MGICMYDVINIIIVVIQTKNSANYKCICDRIQICKLFVDCLAENFYIFAKSYLNAWRVRVVTSTEIIQIKMLDENANIVWDLIFAITESLLTDANFKLKIDNLSLFNNAYDVRVKTFYLINNAFILIITWNTTTQRHCFLLFDYVYEYLIVDQYEIRNFVRFSCFDQVFVVNEDVESI